MSMRTRIYRPISILRVYIQIIQNSVMYSKEHYSSLLYNGAKRPQTPLAASNYSPSPHNNNRSFTKAPAPIYSPHASQFHHLQQPKQPMSKSRISVNSSASQLSYLQAGEKGEIFPEDLIFLLKNEGKNIGNFKEKIEKEKSRVENDFAVLKMEIDHILEDLKLSVQAELDQVYKVFISKYSEVKTEVQEIRRLRKEILMANYVGPTNPPQSKDSSNYDIISEIEKDSEHFRNFKVYGYLTEMQKAKLNPILDICNELILIGSADCPFYRSKEMSVKAKEIKSGFSANLVDIYQRLDQFVISPQQIVSKQRQEEQNTLNVLQNLEHQENTQNIERNPFDVNFPQNRYSPPHRDQVTEPMKKRPEGNLGNMWEEPKSQAIKSVGKTGQGMVTKWSEGVSLKRVERVVTDHEDSILCIFFINNKYVATGSKDKTINIYTLEGKKVTTLRGHDASICSLTTIKANLSQSFLASGSDHGCCCLILWDTRTWTISSRIQAHNAALTSIVDLEDGQHLLTGSYDKKINLFNYQHGEVVSSYNNKSGITCMVLTTDKQKIVTSSLQKTITVWGIVSKANGIGLGQLKVIPNNDMVCIMEASLLRPEIVMLATRDGKLKMINIENSKQVEKAYSVNERSIIELVVIEREMMSDSPLVLSCSSKDKSLCLTRMESGQNELVRINGPFNIQFGCGIGPKIVVCEQRGGMMAILSQSADCREFSLFEMQLK